jgi:ribonuclease HI
MAKKYYVVWAGRTPGIYEHWPEAERQVKGHPGARFKSFATRQQAEEAFGGQAPVRPRASRSPSAKDTAEPSAPRADVAIYCDGACQGNPGPSGTGIAVYHQGTLDQLWYGLYRPAGTNNIAELLGLLHALMMAREPLAGGQSVTIYSDSQYSIDCITTWAFGWKAKGWTKKGGEIKNLELIQAAHALYVELKGKIRIEHVRGHAGIEGNELADRMSMVAIERREPDLKPFTDPMSVAEVLSLERG